MQGTTLFSGIEFCFLVHVGWSTCEERWTRWSDLWLFLALAKATMFAVLDRREENCFRLCPFCSTKQFLNKY
jgi:hypothetical protein